MTLLELRSLVSQDVFEEILKGIQDKEEEITIWYFSMSPTPLGFIEQYCIIRRHAGPAGVGRSHKIIRVEGTVFHIPVELLKKKDE